MQLSVSQGGSHDAVRHTIRPEQRMCWLHWPYRKDTHPVFRRPQFPLAQPQVRGPHDPPQKALPPAHEPSHVQVEWQST